jgi:hypothetical protein
VEFQIVALVALLPLVLGVLQVALLLVGHDALGFAVFEAARAGAVGHARQPAMVSGLAEGLMPFFGAGTADVVAARLRAEREARLYARIERLSPTAQDFVDYGETEEGQRFIPNDALEYRSAVPRRGGGRTLQQANHLRIRVRYCHELVVPLIDRLLPAILQRLDVDPDAQVCYAAGRVPLRVEGSAPLQSAAWP